MNEHATLAVSGPPEFIAAVARFMTEYDRNEASWIAALRASGVKAAHPDDGWVDRTANSIRFCYPQFDDGVSVGDLIAIGNHRKSRIARVTAVVWPQLFREQLGPRYVFEETT